MSAVLAGLALAATLLGAGAASAQPPGPGGPCRVYWNDPQVQHNIPGVPGLPGTPYYYCDY